MNHINRCSTRNLIVFVVSAFALVILTISNPPAWSQEEYKVGAVLPLTGPAAFMGEAQQKALDMLVEKINHSGGVNQMPLKLITLDTKGKPASAFEAVNQLISRYGVVAIIGPSLTSTTHAVVGTVAKKKIPLVTLAEGVEIHGSDHQWMWIFQTAPGHALRIKAALMSMKSQDISQFIFSGFTPSVIHLKPLVEKVSKELGLYMVSSPSYGREANPARIISQLKQAASGKAVLFFDPFLPSRHPKFMSAFREWGQTAPNQTPSSFYFLGAGLNPMLYKLNMSPRLTISNHARLVVPTFLYPDLLPCTQENRKNGILNFAQLYKAKSDARVSVYPFYARDALKLIEQVLQIVKSKNPQLIRDQIAQTKAFDGLVGRYDFSHDNHSGLSPVVFRAEQQKDDGCDPGLYPCHTDCENDCCAADGC
jgi:branched-chain amino acid transport system substrate-binding protein